MGFAANSHGSAMSPDQEPQRAPTSSTSPHPRHRSHSLCHDSWYLAGTQQHHDYEFHLVDNDFDPAFHHHQPAPDHDHDPEAGRDDTSHDAGRSSDSVPTGHRRSDREALVSIRTGRGPVGHRDRLARIELPTRRHQSNELRWDVPVGCPSSRRPLRSIGLRLAHRSMGSRAEHRSSSVALCVLGTLTLAALTLILWEVL